jgi:hypothetical protein
LEAHPETVEKHFEALVPTEISYELFWKRYFYRCSYPDRIAKEWEQEEEANRLSRAKALSGRTFLRHKPLWRRHGRPSASWLPSDSRGSEGEVPVECLLEINRQRAARSGKGGGLYLLGSGGRPPFVMNTAVDEEDDG